MDRITRKLVETVRQITEGHTPDTKRVVTEPRAPAIFYDYTQKLSERPRWEKVAADMGIDSSGIEQMSSQVHDEWMKRNPKADWNAAQHVPYEQLPESEKVKDREHVQQILVLHRENVAEPNTSLETHIDRLANAFGAQAHEAWRAGWEEKNGKDTPRMKSVSGGTQVNINVPWKDLHPEWKRENYQAGAAAARALYNVPSPTSDLSESAAWTRKAGKDPKGGLNKKGVESYRRENPGSKLQTAVTTDPKKLKKGTKKAKRRLSFCRRMKGMKAKLTSAKTARDPDSRINKALRKWNCE
jgi:hypothetical protein